MLAIKSNWARHTLAASVGALTGALHGLAFGHPHAAVLEFASLATLAAICFRFDVLRSPGVLFLLLAGFWFSSYAWGLRWMAEGLTSPLTLGPALGALIYLSLCLALSAVSVVSMWGMLLLSARLHSSALRCALVSGALVVSDFLRELLLPSFPWLCVGYAHVDSLFAPLMPILGAEGVAWAAQLAALLTGCLLACWFSARARAGLLACLGILALGLGISWRIEPTLTRPALPMHIALMQTAESMHDKFAASRLGRHVGDLAQFAQGHDARLIIAPETSVPTTIAALSAAQKLALDASVTTSRAIIFGAFAEDSSGAVYNSAVLLEPAVQSAGAVRESTYIKQHLAPIGEYAPRGFQWLAELLGFPMSDLRATRDPGIQFEAFGITVIPSVCLDLLYGEDLRAVTRKPRILVNLSSLAFFANPLARTQFVEIARARALEQQLPVLMAANFAPTAFIDAQGTVRSELAAGKAGGLEVDATPTLGTTPFARFGNLFLYVLLALTCAVFLVLTAMSLRERRPGSGA